MTAHSPNKNIAMEITRDGKRYLRIWPHGSQSPIEVSVVSRMADLQGSRQYIFYGTLDSPTLRPSIPAIGKNREVFRFRVTNGKCYYLPGPLKELSKKTRPLQPLGWQCDLGDEGMDRDWREKSDSSGECDGHPGQHWTWRECRVCGEQEDENSNQTKK